ncbi:prepilin-type N-terminal cleavage/methylation domain-containing protein [Candidatus Sumerlaeota bacterium]|nr:prepilin-type N-terminal cleavage/methylation domain-containing protein [Candidatus Sumerlaeota bacterium]
MPSKRAFTLIELLIVVAIIAILAAIAVPNFLEAQLRSKVARVRADMRSMAVALEVYNLDNNGYPRSANPPTWQPPTETWRLTTPVAYIGAVPRDPFVHRAQPALVGGPFGAFGEYIHYVDSQALDQYWLLFSYGPDGDLEFSELHYDPTNGTVSDGDIYYAGSANK